MIKIYQKRNKAFTLAEVLLTLTIIGVVAASVIPGLINNTKNSEYKAAYKKMFATISNMHNKFIMEQKIPFAHSNEMMDEYKKNLNYTQYCSNAVAQGCWHNLADIRTYAGKQIMSNSVSPYPGFILADGSLIGFSGFSDDENNYTTENIPYLFTSRTYKIMYVDINGFKKPNKIGVDIQVIDLRANQVLPGGAKWCTSYDCCDKTGSGTDYLRGAGCAAKILTNQDF